MTVQDSITAMLILSGQMFLHASIDFEICSVNEEAVLPLV